jgi:hypothetical protein
MLLGLQERVLENFIHSIDIAWGMLWAWRFTHMPVVGSFFNFKGLITKQLGKMPMGHPCGL